MSPERDEVASYPCPACGRTLYAWTAARHPLEGDKLVLDRCESCGLVVTRAAFAPDPGELPEPRTDGTIELPNRRSFAAGIGGAQWAWMRPDERRLHPTPRAAELLYRKRGIELELAGTPLSRDSYLGMLQTMVNAFTLRDNFVTNSRRGRLQADGTRQRLAFALDWVVSALVAIPLAVLALPAEALGAALKRGGRMRLVPRRDREPI